MNNNLEAKKEELTKKLQKLAAKRQELSTEINNNMAEQLRTQGALNLLKELENKE
jgi:outer membrane murein-binding lipoprotein Lpp